MSLKKVIFIYLPTIILLYLSFNLGAIYYGAEFCKSEGCQISKSLLNIDQKDLYILAIFGSITMLISGFLILKMKNQENIKNLRYLFRFILMNMILAETILLTYLYLKTDEYCTICIIFYSLLLLNFLTLMFSAQYNRLTYLSIVPTVIITLLILDIKKDVESPKIDSKYLLIQSDKCPSCKQVKEYFKYNNIEFKKADYQSYIPLLNNLNINKIPVLIVKNNEKNNSILEGSIEIIKYLKEEQKTKYKKIDKKVIKNYIDTMNNFNNSLKSNQNVFETGERTDYGVFSLSKEKEGCEIDFKSPSKEIEDCD